MRFLGFYLGRHDSNVAIVEDGRVKYIQSERVTGVKHHRATMAFIKDICNAWGVQHFDAIAFSDGNRNDLGKCEVGELVKEVELNLNVWAKVPTFCLDHHYAHILSVWPLVDTQQVDVGVAIDAMGDNGIRARILANPGSLNTKILYSTTSRTFGTFLQRVGLMMGLSGNTEDFAGKVMGAQAYGLLDHDYIDAVDVDTIGERVFDLIEKIPWQGQIPADQLKFFDFENLSFRNWLCTCHFILEQYVVKLFKRYCSSDQVITFSGGCAQNTIYNARLFQIYPQLHIPPHCYDGGISLGCLEFLRLYYQQPRFSTEHFPFWQDDATTEQPSEAIIKRVADLLASGKIIGWFQGYGEIGPRALGHRSILMNPQIKDAKNIINKQIKHREHWRPYAPSILESQVNSWFDIRSPSPFMLQAVSVNEDKKDIIPGVVHVCF